MIQTKSWEITDEFWEEVKDLIPQKQRDPNKKYKRAVGGGRPSIDSRKILEAIFYVLRTGIQWKALPKEKFGASSSIHRYFMAWSKAGVFENMWKAGLEKYNIIQGIDWEWLSIDGSNTKAPLAQESVGASPTDRGKKWEQKTHPRRRQRSSIVSSGNRCE